MKYIVLLRGVMPTGKNKLKMADFRTVLTESGYGNVETYIQSGNALVESDKNKDDISRHIHEVVKQRLGPELPVVVKTIPEFKAIIEANPYDAEDYPNKVSFCAMYQGTVDKALIEAFDTQQFENEYITFGEHAIYYFLPQGAHNAKLSNNFLERKLSTVLTSRNQNTMEKLLKKALNN